MAKKKKKTSNSYWMKFGGSNSSNLPAYRRYENGGSAGKDQTSDIVNDPTFKTWYATNAKRADVAQSSSNLTQLKSLFLNDINFPGNAEMPVFSDEIDDYGNTDKSQRDLGMSMDMIKKFGGTNLPKYAKGGYSTGGGNRSDYSSVNDRNMNAGTSFAQPVGDSNALQYLDYAVPGLGTAADFLVDLWGYKGEQKQFRENSSDANESAGTLDVIDRPDAIKGTLDLSTRKDALAAQANFTQVEPTFSNYVAPRMLQTAGAGVGRYAMGQMGTLGGSGAVDTGGIGAEDLAGSLDGMANFGGAMGRTDIKRNLMTGPTEMESGMDLKNKTKMNFGGGGAKMFGPGAGNGMEGMGMGPMMGGFSGARNPYGTQSMMQATGMAGEQALEQGGQTPPQNYEAEGGEVIMHEPGNQPNTSGNIESVGSNEMVSKLEGSSHDAGGEIVSGEGEQYVFSNELKSDKWGNISFSDAAEKIAKNISKYEGNAEEGDDITKSTAESMIAAWEQKLVELRGEQETKREEKFIEMVNSGADKNTLMQNFPDLTEQMMAEEQMAAQQPQGELDMQADNPMGNIDMEGLAPEDQQLIGAKYGLPHYNNGGEFDPYDFNSYTNDNVDFFKLSLMGDEDLNLSVGKDGRPSKKDLTSILTQNFEEDGALFNGDMYNDAGLLSDAILTDYGTKRSAHIEEATGLKRKPKRGDYKGVENTLQKDKASWSMYNSGLSGNWSENFGADSDMSERKYFKTFYNDLISKGTDPELAATLLAKEKMKKADLDNANLETATEETELSDSDKAARLIEQQQASIKNKRMLGDIGNGLMNLAPTIYNFAKGTEDAEVEQFQSNQNEDEVEALLRGLTKKDISEELRQNDASFNNLKYLARDASDGSSANAMNTLLRGQIFKQSADAATYEAAEESNQANKIVLADYLNKSGENNKAENIRVEGINSQNRAAVEAFMAKGWEGLSGSNQLRQQMKNQVDNDETLKGLLDDIYPDVHKYKTETGGVDLEGLIKAHPELADQLKEYFKKAK